MHKSISPTFGGRTAKPAREIANGWSFCFDRMLHPHIGLTADFAGQ
jgi:hypothetical protein